MTVFIAPYLPSKFSLFLPLTLQLLAWIRKCLLQSVLTFQAVLWHAAHLKRKSQRGLRKWEDGDSSDQMLDCLLWQNLKNPECMLESSLPFFVTGGDRCRWGKRLIQGLACIRMWLLIEVWEGCQSLWLYLPLPSVSQPLFAQSICPLPALHSHCS